MANKATVINEIKMQFPAVSINEGMARAVVSAFCAQLNPTIEEIADIKCAVSEAVTNSIVHGYREKVGDVYIRVRLYSDRNVKIEIRDKGCGISDIEQAMTPLFTTDHSGERSGMGFTVMESFTDKLSVKSKKGEGTVVSFSKKLSDREYIRYGI